MRHKSLYGKVIIVAGRSGGIGSEVCKLLAKQGATIAIANRRNNHSEDLLDEIKKMRSESILILENLTSWNSWEALISNVYNQFQKIDILINCVGTISPGSFEELNITEIDNCIKTNLLCTVYGTKAALPIIKNQKHGHIINVGSLGGIVPMPYESIYSTTKFAVRGFSLSLSEELKNTGIKISLISPGSIKTAMLDLEATNEKSTISFINKVMPPKFIAEIIYKTIIRPQREVILPKFTSKLSMIIGIHPKLFALLFPLLNALGRVGIKNYVNKYLTPARIL